MLCLALIYFEVNLAVNLNSKLLCFAACGLFVWSRQRQETGVCLAKEEQVLNYVLRT